MSPPNHGIRRRLTLDGEHYYLIVTAGPDGAAVDITCPRENAPEHAKMRGILEAVTSSITEMLAEVNHADA